MAKITAYEATDGKIIKDRKVFIDYSRGLVASARLKTLIEAQVTDPAVAAAAAAFYATNISAIRDLVNSKDITLDGQPGDGDGDGDETQPESGAVAGGEPAVEPAAAAALTSASTDV